MKRRNKTLLYDVDGEYFCPDCFRVRAEERDDETVFEVTLSTVIALCAASESPQFACSACGKVAVETPSLRLENVSEAGRGILENVPDRCPACGDDQIIAQFEELGTSSRGRITLSLKQWFCLGCGTQGKVGAEVTLHCRAQRLTGLHSKGDSLLPRPSPVSSDLHRPPSIHKS